MAITALYRLSSGECIKISLLGQTFADRDADFWGVITDPFIPNGTEIRDPDGNLRVLGYAKIFEAPDTIRNATQEEIDTFAAAQTDDENQMAANRAKEFVNTHPQFRKLMTAFADILKDEINILRVLHSLPDRTLQQFKDAILNRISKDD